MSDTLDGWLRASADLFRQPAISLSELGLMLARFRSRWRAARRAVIRRRFDEQRIRRIPRGMTGDPGVNIAKLSAELEAIDDARPDLRFRDPRLARRP